MNEAAAPASVNFRLLRPTLEGVDYDPNALGVRLEAGPDAAGDSAVTTGANWSAMRNCSVRYRLSSRFGRLRVKQFLYDWGPCSTLDHAALCDVRPDRMRPWPLDGPRLAWTGWDYAQCRALSMLAWDTNVEIRELEGSHPRGWLLDLARSFEPVSATPPPPMARRSYWSRWPRYDRNMVGEPGYRLPSSLWLWRWPWLAVDHEWSGQAFDPGVAGLRVPPAEMFAPLWTFDSACFFGPREDPGEVQLLFRPACGLGHARLWLRRFARLPGAIREPAAGDWPLSEDLRGDYPIHRSRLAGSGGWRAFVASRTLEYGPHDIVWWEGRHGFLLQISAAADHDLNFSIDQLAKLNNNATLSEPGA